MVPAPGWPRFGHQTPGDSSGSGKTSQHVPGDTSMHTPSIPARCALLPPSPQGSTTAQVSARSLIPLLRNFMAPLSSPRDLHGEFGENWLGFRGMTAPPAP